MSCPGWRMTTMIKFTVWKRPRGAAFSNSGTPPPDPPKFSNPALCNLRFWGKLLAPEAPEVFFFFWLPEGEISCHPLCLYSNY